jgi:hypothetical protein
MQPSDILLDRQLDKMPIGIKEVNRFENAVMPSAGRKWAGERRWGLNGTMLRS